ncbi:MAG: CRISPR-associated endonuclease Cas1 [Iamia sp.]
MRYLNTLYVTEHRAKVRRSKGSLVTTGPQGAQRVPLEAVDNVVLLGGGQITTDAMAACAERGINIAGLRRSGAVRFFVSRPQGGNVHLRVAQHRVSADSAASLEISRHVVAAKLQSSRRMLLRWARDERGPSQVALRRRAEVIEARLQRVTSVRDPDHLRGIEGDAARAHFAGMSVVLADSRFPFTQRNRRPPRDPVNALLGFGYGLLLTEVAGAAEAVGLDPQVGFFHRPRSGRASLALDLIEELRCMVDLFVVRTIRRREVVPADFTMTPGGATYLSDDGRTRILRLWETAKSETVDHVLLRRRIERWALPTVQATLLARNLRGDLSAYPPYVHAT